MATTRSTCALWRAAVALFLALFARESASFVVSRAPSSFLLPITRTASWRNGRIHCPDNGKWDTATTRKKYRQRQASSQRTTTTSMNVLQTRSDNVAAATHGGDFAGFMATFDLKGKLIPIQVETPSTGLKTLEVLISEGQEDTISSFRRKGGLFSWERKTSPVLPRNEEGTVKVEHTNLTSSWVTRADYDNDEDVISAAIPKGSSIRSILGMEQYPETSTPTIETETLCAATGVASDDKKGSTDKFRVETTFSLPDNQRLRIMVPVSLSPEPNATSYSRETRTENQQARASNSKKSGPPPPLLLEEPIVVIWEFRASRQVMLMDDDDDDKGGGDDLDPRRVQLAARNFASRPIIPWQPLSRDDDDDEDDTDSSSHPSTCWDMVPPTMLLLPGCNTTITFGYQQVQKEDDEDDDDDDVNSEDSETSKLEWFLEVGHYIPERNNIRQAVRRTFRHDGFARPPLYFDTMSLVEHFVEQGERPAPGKFRYGMGQ